MRELTRLAFTNESDKPSFSSLVKLIDSLKTLHKVDEIYLWPTVEKQLDASSIDVENFDPETLEWASEEDLLPMKEIPVLSLWIK